MPSNPWNAGAPPGPAAPTPPSPTPTFPPGPAMPVTPPPAAPVPVYTRPGDVILSRVLSWWDSGQIKRAAVGIAATIGPVIWDLIQRNDLTWRTAAMAVAGALFTWMGWSRLKSPDIATGTKLFDVPATPAPVTAFVPAKLMADLQAREAGVTTPPKGDPK